MGWPKLSKEEREKKRAEESEQARLSHKTRQRPRAERIVDDIFDSIVTEVIRPGPKQEERECTEVAQELRDMRGRMIEKVLARL